LEKNRDTFSADLHALIQSSRMHLLQRIFDDTVVTTRNNSATVSAQFRKSLDQLMQQLNQTQPFFIKCIKPNDYKKALLSCLDFFPISSFFLTVSEIFFVLVKKNLVLKCAIKRDNIFKNISVTVAMIVTMDCDLVLRQLRYSGMLDTIKIRRKGYPVRHDFGSFVSRYRVLVDSIVIAHHMDNRSLAEHICKQMLGDGSDFQLGKTKVFLKEKDDLYLEKEYHRMIEYRATVIQRHVKGWIARSSFRKKKEAAIMIQKHWRRYIYQKRRAQAACRGTIVRKKVTELKRAGGRRMFIEEYRRDDVKDEVEEEELVRTNQKNYDLEKYQFGKFAATYFQSQVSCSHSKKPLKTSLLTHEDKRTQLAAMAVWVTILRFMGDMPDVESTSNGENAQMVAYLNISIFL
uniref:Myosin motor domain-containing protein n=1 Tax=Angiostrongylus cantonensis TaxID=6313 RepID=A0A0K0DR02_ANGCA